MSEGNRFWSRMPTVAEQLGIPEDMIKGSNRVLTRKRGEIPGCVPAVDVFVEMTEEEVAQAILSDPYWKVWDDYRHGVIGWNEWLNHAIHKRPQRSFIKNRAVPIKQNYYSS